MVEVAARHFFGGESQRAQGTRECARQQDTDDQREHGRAERREGEGLVGAFEVGYFLRGQVDGLGRGQDRADENAVHFEGRVAGEQVGWDALAGNE